MNKEDKLVLKKTEAATSFQYGYLLKRFMPFIKPYLPRIIINFAISIPNGLMDAITAAAIQPYMDLVINAPASPKRDFYVIAIPFAIVLFTILQGVIKYLNAYLTDWTTRKVTYFSQKFVYKKLLSMNTRFYDVNSSGSIITRYLTDPNTAATTALDQIKCLLTTGVGSLSLICVLLYNSWQLAIIGILLMGAAITPAIFLRKRILKISNASISVNGDMSTNYFESCGGNKTITAYNLAGRQYKEFCNQVDNLFDLQMSLTKRVALASPVMYVIASIGFASVLTVGNYLITHGYMTIGNFGSFLAALILLYKPMKSMGNTLTSIQTFFVSLSRVLELCDLETEIKDSENAIEINGIKDSISFENVNFEYVQNVPVIKNLNLSVKKGETLAIVGNSGGGKTTLVNLLPRFYELQSGSIKIDDVDIKNIKLDSLRNSMAIVFQDNFLFAGTIRENILMGNPNATEDELKSVIKSAHLDEFLDTLPDGIDTIVGERGTSLSGGQRQRIAIARAMIKNAEIVVLDEATSALDNESEAIVQKAIDNLMMNKTVFVIAHRLSTIQNANRIAVINEGSLVELGSHEELMNIKNGEYKHLYEMQFRQQEKIDV
jgi:subfamily B ATP-binding cassette protein MsbA